MLHPTLTELLEPSILDAEDVLPDRRLLVRAAVPRQLLITDVAGFGAKGKCLDAVNRGVVGCAPDVTDDDIDSLFGPA